MKKIGIIGLGNMGFPIYESIKSKFEVFCYDPFNNNNDIAFESDISELTKKSDIIIISVKPNQVINVLKAINLPKTFISIAAGISLSTLKENIAIGSHVVRIMPNLPLQIREGCMGYIGDQEAFEDVKSIFSDLGFLLELSNESSIDAVTGLSGSGPAFVFSFIQALAEGGVKSGLSYNDSLNLAIQTVKGSAMLLESELKINNTHPSQLRNKVTSAGGTTIFGLDSLEKNNFHYSVMNAVYEAFKRAKDLKEK